MIDKKKIKEAAKSHMLAVYNEEYFPVKVSEIKEQCESDFKAGADWAMKEFLQGLWKGSEIEPKPKSGNIIGDIIAISDINLTYTFRHIEVNRWKQLAKDYYIERWCYLDDILPSKGGEE